ncbi:MAG: hypothetical protein Q9162_000732 [Coniocarpon cinnabarinum]
MSAKLLRRNQPVRSLALATESHVLVFVNNRVELYESSQADLLDYKPLSYSVHGTLGLITIEDDVFICVVTGANKVASVRPGETVQQILSVDFHCLNRADHDYILDQDAGLVYQNDFADDDVSSPRSQPPQAQQAHPCLALKKLLGDGSFYFSTDFDLTNRLQDRSEIQGSFAFDDFNKAYLWNSYMIKPLIDFRSRLSDVERSQLDSTRLLTSATRGFARTYSIPPGSSPVRSVRHGMPSTLTLISRLSCMRAGTRFNARGIDDEGHVANFVESEVIFSTPTGLTFSYVQVRGSIPLFWEQQAGFVPQQQKIHITRSTQATQPAFDKHFDDLEMRYDSIHIVNLLSDTKTQEIELSDRYRYHVAHSPLNSRKDGERGEHQLLRETDYDFHAETQNGRYEAASSIAAFIRDSADAFGYCLMDVVGEPGQGSFDLLSSPSQRSPHAALILQQQGVFRTNCLDCLDRTNLIQTIISRMAFEAFLSQRGERITGEFNARHGTLWADNGDALSRIYAGTNALKSSFTRVGKSTLAGFVSDIGKNVQRTYMNNFTDNSRQQTIDLLLGRLVGQAPVQLYDPINDWVTAQLSQRSAEFSNSRNITVWTGTLNLNGRDTGLNADLTSWLSPPALPPNQRTPSIIAIGFQEIVELTSQTIMNTEPLRRQQWEKTVSTQLHALASRNNTEEYILLRGGQLVGASLSIFIQKSLLPVVKNVEGSLKKTGLQGLAGNKGAVAIRLDIADTSLCFVTAHMAAGFANYEERNRDYRTISHGLRFGRNRSIEDHSAVIWLGDFNYRIGLGHADVLDLIQQRNWRQLYENDQLHIQMTHGLAFQHYAENEIKFPPTYKYDIGRDTYDTSEKARIPAWCDRILRKGTCIRQLSYYASDLNISDHRPVYATFELRVSMIDAKRRDRLAEELYHSRRATTGSALHLNGAGSDVSDPDDLINLGNETGLPPASSEKRKWWLDGGLPVRSQVGPPKAGMVSNPEVSNPFVKSDVPEWVRAVPERKNVAVGGSGGVGRGARGGPGGENGAVNLGAGGRYAAADASVGYTNGATGGVRTPQTDTALRRNNRDVKSQETRNGYNEKSLLD